MIRHIIFDLDGVIIDSKENMRISWYKTCKKHNIKISFESYFKQIGIPFINILNNLNIKNNQKKIENSYRKYSIEFFNKFKFFKNVIKTLRYLKKKGIILSIVTSKDKIRTNLIISKIPIKFDSVISPNNKFRGKPSSDQILYTIAITNTELSNTVYIGDTINDLKTAKKSSIRYVHANYGYGKRNLSNFLNINKFDEIEKLL